MNEPERAAEAAPCTCYDIRKEGVIYPVLCKAHAADYARVVGYNTYRYQRYFDTEADAKDRRRIIVDNYDSEAYGTRVLIYPIGRWWLVLAWWGSAD